MKTTWLAAELNCFPLKESIIDAALLCTPRREPCNTWLAVILQYLTGIRNCSSVSAACQYHLEGLCPVFPSHMLLQEANFPAFPGRGSVFQYYACEDLILCSVPCALSRAPFSYSLSLPSYYKVTMLIFLSVIIISEQRKNEILIKESFDMENTQENCHLWEEQGLRLSEAKAVIKDNAHETGCIKGMKHKNMEGYFIPAFRMHLRPRRDIAGRRNTVTLHSH